jgi:phosphocarrier protein HPr
VKERTVVLASRHGLHARPAAELVRLAGKFRSDVKLTKDDITVDGKSIMGVMMLAASRGTRLIILADGEDEQDAIDSLEKLVGEKFGEQE